MPGFEEQLEGASAGDERTVEITFPDDYPAEHLAGKDGRVRRRRSRRSRRSACPSSTTTSRSRPAGTTRSTSCAREIEERLREADERAIEAEFRQAAVDAVVERSEVDIPHDLVHAKAHEMWHRTAHRLSAQGVDPRRYLQLSGKTEEELVTEAEPEAEQALRREAVLAAIVEAEGIEVSDEEVEDALREAAGPAGRARSRSSGRSSARAHRAPTRRCARTSRCARRWTSSSSAPSRSRWARPRRARSSGRPRRKPRRGPARSGRRAPGAARLTRR